MGTACNQGPRAGSTGPGGPTDTNRGGVLLTIAGAVAQILAPPVTLRNRAELLTAAVVSLHRPAEHALGQIHANHLNWKTLVPNSQIDEVVIPTIEASLNEDNTLPIERLKIVQVSPNDFWLKAWTTKNMIATGKGDVRIVGGLVNLQPKPVTDARAWLAVFKKIGGHWHHVSIAAPFTYAPKPFTTIDNVAVDIADDLPGSQP